MATLLNCIECNKVVSSQAFQCPHCKTRYPLGVKCSVCCNVLKRTEALKITKEYGGAENRISVKFFHSACHKQVNQLRLGRARIACPLCKVSIEFDTSSHTVCPNCGHNFPTKLKNPSFASCCYCGFQLNKSLEVAVKEASRPFLEGWITETVYAHKVCYTPERQNEERNLQRKEQLEIERLKKKRAETLQNQQLSKRKEILGLSIFIGLVVGILAGALGVALHFILGFGSSWKVAGLWGSIGAFILTVATVWILSLIE